MTTKKDWHLPSDIMPPAGVYVLVYLRNRQGNSNYAVEVACGDPTKCSGWRTFNRDQVLGWTELPPFTLNVEAKSDE